MRSTNCFNVRPLSEREAGKKSNNFFLFRSFRRIVESINGTDRTSFDAFSYSICCSWACFDFSAIVLRISLVLRTYLLKWCAFDCVADHRRFLLFLLHRSLRFKFAHYSNSMNFNWMVILYYVCWSIKWTGYIYDLCYNLNWFWCLCECNLKCTDSIQNPSFSIPFLSMLSPSFRSISPTCLHK